MTTHRERLQKEYDEEVKQYDELVQILNKKGRRLAIEQMFTHLRLYKEQKDEIEDIMSYFDRIGMDAKNNTTETIIAMALKEFHHYILSLDSSSDLSEHE
ncbi:hypothetical protein [Salsuginibacillus kocurii]|uniref:hypothetical protein n=1 Tax=Salsuginibacillus kocurii TaxID=427078 RepID=UPI00036B2151|nr:hypothetical protein [Salsuginibacillus kocurii]